MAAAPKTALLREAAAAGAGFTALVVVVVGGMCWLARRRRQAAAPAPHSFGIGGEDHYDVGGPKPYTSLTADDAFGGAQEMVAIDYRAEGAKASFV